MNVAQDTELTRSAADALWGSWSASRNRRADLWVLNQWANNRLGVPDLAEGASDELKGIAKISKLGMCRVAVNTFAAGLSVVGFRSPEQADDDPVWKWWQQNRLDALQTKPMKDSLIYGIGYGAILPDTDRSGSKARPSFYSPRDAFVEYEEIDDLFPTSAVLTRKVGKNRSVYLVDDTTVTPFMMKASSSKQKIGRVDGFVRNGLVQTGEPWEHGATYNGKPVCPVVRFVDEALDDDDESVFGIGVVEPLIELNQAINHVNFDRLVVTRFGAHDQKLIIGWTDSKERLLKLSAAHVGAIDEHPDDVKVERWQASPLAPYTELLNDYKEQFALEARIPLWAASKISNVSTDTAALFEAAHQRALRLKRRSLGESWEQFLRLAIAMTGGTQPDDGAEVIWEDTNNRAFASVVDGIVKLGTAGVPIEELLDLIPGMTQQRIKSITNSIRKTQATSRLEQLLETVPAEPELDT